MLERLTHNWSLKILALAIALAMWIHVVGQEKSEVSVRVPVEITNVPSYALVVSEAPAEVEARLFGPRTLVRRVAAERLSKAVDLTGLGPGTHVFQVQPEDLRLPPGVRVVRISPDSFTLTLAQRMTREVPVQPVFRGKPPEGLALGEIAVKPEKVLVVGAKDDLADLDWVFTQPIELGERKEPFAQLVQLRLPRGKSVRLSRAEVEVSVSLRAAPAPAPPPKVDGATEGRTKGKQEKEPRKR